MNEPVSMPEPVFERLVRIETKLDLSGDGTKDHEQRIRRLEDEVPPGTIRDHETRLRRLERSAWIAAGVAAAVGGSAGALLGPMLGGQ